MKRRAFAMFDALGFKGIWKRTRPSRIVIDKLEALKKSMTAELGGSILKKLYKDPNSYLRSVSASFLSDTVILEVRAKPVNGPNDEARAHAIGLLLAASRSIQIMVAAVATEPRFVYRGVITFGRCTKKRDFVLGPAVDEASTLMDLAQGAFVWLSPTAMKVWKNSPFLPEGLSPLVEYRVPLKGGDSFLTQVLDPTWNMSRKTAETFVGQVERSFGSDILDHQIKAQNTLAFYRQRLEDPKREWLDDSPPEPAP